MKLRLGDRFTDEAGTWEIVGSPSTQRGGKEVKVSVQHDVEEPGTLREQWWPAYRRVTVIREAG
jgi:hypothetical protein